MELEEFITRLYPGNRLVFVGNDTDDIKKVFLSLLEDKSLRISVTGNRSDYIFIVSDKVEQVHGDYVVRLEDEKTSVIGLAWKNFKRISDFIEFYRPIGLNENYNSKLIEAQKTRYSFFFQEEEAIKKILSEYPLSDPHCSCKEGVTIFNVHGCQPNKILHQAKSFVEKGYQLIALENHCYYGLSIYEGEPLLLFINPGGIITNCKGIILRDANPITRAIFWRESTTKDVECEKKIVEDYQRLKFDINNCDNTCLLCFDRNTSFMRTSLTYPSYEEDYKKCFHKATDHLKLWREEKKEVVEERRIVRTESVSKAGRRKRRE